MAEEFDEYRVDTGEISVEEIDRRMALNTSIDWEQSNFRLNNPKIWTDSFKEWHRDFIEKHCDVEQHCQDCKYCKEEWYD